MFRNAFSAVDIECEWSQSKKICLRERKRRKERHAASLRFGLNRRMN